MDFQNEGIILVVKIKLSFFAFFVFLALAPVSSFAGTLPAGFVGEALWLSKEQFFAGETIQLFTAVRNSTSQDIAGEIIFSDAGKELGKVLLTLAQESAQIVSFSWTATAGEHTFRAAFTGENGASFQAPRTGEKIVSVDLDTDHDGVGNEADTDDDADGIADAKDPEPLVAEKKQEAATSSAFQNALAEGKTLLKENVPAVSAAGERIFAKAENVREKLGAAAHAARESVAADIKREEESSKKLGDKEEKSGWQRAFQTGELLALSLAGSIFNSRYLFYPLALALTFWILWRAFCMVRRIRSGRRW